MTTDQHLEVHLGDGGQADGVGHQNAGDVIVERLQIGRAVAIKGGR